MTFYIGKEPTIGNYAKMDSISAVNGQATYNLLKGGVAFAPQSANHVICSLNSIIQNPGSSFTISGSQIIFASNLQTGDSIDFILVLGDVLSIGIPSDDTIDSAKLKTNSVVEAKIQDDAVTRDKINAISTTSLPSFEAKGTSGQTDGYIQLNCEQNSHGIKLKSPSHSSSQSYTIIMPDNQIAQDKFMKVKSITGSGSTAVGQLEFADAGGGKIGQVIQTHKADGFSTTSGVLGSGFVDVTGLSATITPSATTSKILIMGSVDVSESSSNRIFLRVKRDSTIIGNASDSGMSSNEVHKHVFNTGTSSGQNNMSINFLDTPNTTSATTYQFSVTNNQLDNNSTIYVNRNANSGSGNQDAHSTSQITLMEILA